MAFGQSLLGVVEPLYFKYESLGRIKENYRYDLSTSRLQESPLKTLEVEAIDLA